MFVADAMLGRLATWLRLLGIDTVYDPKLAAAGLIRRAFAEGRILLTRNRRLLRRRRLPPHLYIGANEFRGQLREVLDAFQLDPYAQLSCRCSRCNEVLLTIDKRHVCDQVPPYVFATQSTFSRCPACGRTYWAATHVEHMKAELARMKPMGGAL